MTNDASCQVYDAPLKSLLHIIKDCSIARRVWDKILPSPYKVDFFSMDLSSWIRANTLQEKFMVVGKDISWEVVFALGYWWL